MVGSAESHATWSLTLFRASGYGMHDGIEGALFAYGRVNSEVGVGKPCRLPDGVISLLEDSELTGQATECGFVLEMRHGPPHDPRDWQRFDLLFEMNRGCPFDFSGVYAKAGGDPSFEMVLLDHREKSLRPRVWLRARNLPDATLAWLISQDILMANSQFQATLHDFCDLGVVQSLPGSPLPLPGPPMASYEFI